MYDVVLCVYIWEDIRFRIRSVKDTGGVACVCVASYGKCKVAATNETVAVQEIASQMALLPALPLSSTPLPSQAVVPAAFGGDT
jgi:hypothetical protein